MNDICFEFECEIFEDLSVCPHYNKLVDPYVSNQFTCKNCDNGKCSLCLTPHKFNIPINACRYLHGLDKDEKIL